MRKSFIRHTGIAAPLLRNNMEMEYIAPLHPAMHQHGHGMLPRQIESHLHPVTTETPYFSTGAHAFEGIRYFPDGREDPEFILNRLPYRNASILIAGENFGIGSMQTFAVTRLLNCGFKSVIAQSFGPVFFEDSLAHGLLAVELDRNLIEGLANRVMQQPDIALTVDLERLVIERPDMLPISFEMHPRLRNKLLLGLDDLDENIKYSDEADRFLERNRLQKPWIYGSENVNQ